MGGTCDTNGGRGHVRIGIWCADLKARVHLEDPDVDGRIISKWILKKLARGQY